MKKLLASAILLGLAAPQVATAAEEVNVYSYRQPFLVEPMFNEFTKETGIKVNVKFAKKGLAEKLQQEGEYSPADMILTTDISRLVELTNKDWFRLSIAKFLRRMYQLSTVIAKMSGLH